MPPKEESVNVLDSLDSQSDADKDPSGEGKSPSNAAEIEKKVRENLRAEYERKANEKVEAEKSRLTESYEAKIQEILGKDRLTKTDQDNIDSLQQKILSIKTDSNFKPWDKIIRDTVREELESRESSHYERQHASSQKKAETWLAAKAKESGQSVEELGDELMPFLEDRYMDHLPEDRVKMAYDAMNRIKEKYSKGKEKQATADHMEGEGRVMRKVTVKEALSESRKSGEWKNVLSQVARNQNPKPE